MSDARRTLSDVPGHNFPERYLETDILPPRLAQSRGGSVGVPSSPAFKSGRGLRQNGWRWDVTIASDRGVDPQRRPRSQRAGDERSMSRRAGAQRRQEPLTQACSLITCIGSSPSQCVDIRAFGSPARSRSRAFRTCRTIRTLRTTATTCGPAEAGSHVPTHSETRRSDRRAPRGSLVGQ